MNIVIDEKTYNQEFTTVVVCNGRYYGGGYKIGPNSSLNDGLLDVYLIDKLNKIQIAKLLLAMKNGSHEYDKHVKKIRTDKIFIESEKRIDSNVDGEKITDTTFDIELIKNVISVYYNQELIDKVLVKRK